jgi:pimeloyl-ACP methyl ester carboxylesterase
VSAPDKNLTSTDTSGTDHETKVDGATVHYLTAGTASQHLLLLHGSGADSAHLSYRDLVGRLSQNFTVLAPDFPGYGHSEVTERANTTEGLIEFVRSFLDTLGVDKVDVAGLSMGGGVALGLALQHPERVERVVLMGSHGLTRRSLAGYTAVLLTRLPAAVYGWSWQYASASPERTRKAMRRVWGDHELLTSELLEDIRHELARPDAWRVIRNWSRDESRWAGYRTCHLDKLPALDKPVLLLHGAKDKLVPLRDVEKAAPMFPNATLKVLPQVGHWIPREGSAEFAESVKSFLLTPLTTEPQEPS